MRAHCLPLAGLLLLPTASGFGGILTDILKGRKHTYTGPAKAVTLVTFDGAAGSTHKWKELNDPVMGGRSHGTWTQTGGHGVFAGEVAIVPKLHAPGFIEGWVPSGNFADAAPAGADGALVLTVRSSTPSYQGFQVSFAAGPLVVPMYACAAGGGYFGSRGCFKAHFTVPPTQPGTWTEVRIPFSAFTDKWSASTGKPTSTCAQDSSCCVTASLLSSIKALGFWGEGVAGNLNLEVQKVVAEPAAGEH